MKEAANEQPTVKYFVERSAAILSMRSSGLITLGRGRLGIFLLTGGSADANIDIYDGIDSSGDILFSLDATSNLSTYIDFRFSVEYKRGIYIVLTGAGAMYTVTWLPEF